MAKLLALLLFVCCVSSAYAQTVDDAQPEVAVPQENNNSGMDPEEEVNDDTPFQVQAEPPVRSAVNPDIPAQTDIGNLPAGDGNATPIGVNSNADPKNFTSEVSLQALNKITAKTSTLKLKLGEPTKFGNLNITLHKCWKSPPEEDPESKALVEIWEEVQGEPRKKIFFGWMFASSPLISAPEHPVYDITVLECLRSLAKEAKPAATKKK